MAISILQSSIRGDINGNIIPVFQTSNLAPVDLTGKIYYIISETRLSSYSGETWTELGDVDTYEIDGTYSYLQSSTKIDFNLAWGKWVYLKIEGTESGASYEFTDQMLQARRLSHESDNSRTLTYNSSNNTLRWETTPVYSGLLYSQYNLNLEFVESLEYVITFVVGENDEEFTQNYLMTKSNNNRPTIDLTGLPSGNVFIKSVEFKLNVTFQAEPIVISQQKKTLFYIRNYEVKPITFSVDKEIDIFGIHGNLIYNNYIYGSARGSGPNPNYNQFVKINLSDENDIQYLSILDESGNPAHQLEQIIEINGFIYALVTNKLVKINPQTLDYQVFRLYIDTIQVPLIGDDEHVYVCTRDTNYTILKFNLNALNSITDKYADMPAPEASIGVKSLIGNYNNIYVHSGVTDDLYLYAAYTSGIVPSGGLYPTAKILKSDMSFVGYGMTPKATDDMTQDDTHLYYGQEVTIGSNLGTFALNKATLEMVKLSYLAPSDITLGGAFSSYEHVSYMSYASIIFGGYLFDFKLNKKVYLLDTLRVNDWTDEIPAKFTTAEYSYQNAGIINDVSFDYDTQTFHGFVWIRGGAGKSRYVKFTLPDLTIITEPIINIGVVEYLGDGGYQLNATITSSGGTVITEAYFEIYSINDEFVERLDIMDFSVGPKSVKFSTNSSKKIRFVAVNSKGKSLSSFVDLEVVVKYDYVMKGVVYYLESTPEPSVSVYIVDLSTNNIVGTTITSVDGTYSFENLDPEKIYLICGFKENKRILSKVKPPFKIIKG